MPRRQLHYHARVTYVILGLLHITHMSLYDLIKAFEAGASLFYGASAGSIKRALDKLLEEGAVRVGRQAPGVRGRREYSVTSLGTQKFEAWMRQEPRGDFDSTAVARLYFLGLMPPDERSAILARIQERALSDLNRLELVEQEARSTEVPDRFQDVGRFQQAALNYGLSSMRHTYDWFTTFRAEQSQHEERRSEHEESE